VLTVRRMAAAFLAVSIGVTLVALATLLVAAGRPHVPDRLADAAIVVQSPQARTPVDPFPPTRPWSSQTAGDLAARLAELPGVAAAVPDRTFYAQALVDGRPPPVKGQRQDTYEGHGWAGARLGGRHLTSGAPPRAPGEVVVDRALGLSPGASVTLLTATGPSPYEVTGVTDAPGFLVADQVAAALAPGVSAIGVVLAPGADPGEVASAAREVTGGQGRVLVGDERGALEPRDDARARWIGMQVLTGTAALAGFVTVFVVASTFAFAVAQRRRELGLLRTIGATPRQVRRMLYREALVVGTAGSAVGVFLGAVLAPVMGRVLIEAGFEPATFTVRYAWWPIAVSLAAGPVVALAGVWSASRRAARVRPMEALREAVVEQRPMGRLRWATGGLMVAAGIASAVGTATADHARDGAMYALYSACLLITGVTVLAPAAVPFLVRLVSLPLRARPGAVGLLVRETALTATRRTASTAAPVLLTVAFAVLVSGMVRTTTEAYAVGRSSAVEAGWIVAPDRAPGLSDAAATATPGAALLPSTVFVTAGEIRPLTALGVDPAAFVSANRALHVVSGSFSDLHGEDAVVVSESALKTADATWSAPPPGVLPAAKYPVVFADGTSAALRVVAVVTDDSLPGDLLLPRAVVRGHDPSALTSAVYVRERVEPPADSGARVVDVHTWAVEADQAEDRLTWLFALMLIGVSAGYGAIAVAGTLLMAAGGRRRDLRAVRLAGATRRQILSLVVAESALVVLIGAVLGGAVAFAALLGIRSGLSEQAGAPVDLVVPWPVIGSVVALCLVLAVACGAMPTVRMLRHPAVQVEP
jgi:putative ABC transport system permease protein